MNVVSVTAMAAVAAVRKSIGAASTTTTTMIMMMITMILMKTIIIHLHQLTIEAVVSLIPVQNLMITITDLVIIIVIIVTIKAVGENTAMDMKATLQVDSNEYEGKEKGIARCCMDA